MEKHKYKRNEKHKKKNAAFTLIETLLSLSLVLLLTSVLITNIEMNKKPALIDYVFQVEGLIRYTKAEAANTGKKFRLDINNETNKINIHNPFSGGSGEHDSGFPLDRFDVFTNSFEDKLDYEENIDIKIEKENEETIEFYPDGSSESAFLIISDKENTESIQYIITINGLVGNMKHEVIE